MYGGYATKAIHGRPLLLEEAWAAAVRNVPVDAVKQAVPIKPESRSSKLKIFK
jgi:hypothetical protein